MRRQPPKLPPPNQLGAPKRYDEWRRQQLQALWDLSQSEKRFDGMVLPTGSGKTLAYLVYLLLEMKPSDRALVLTSTRPLMDQITKDWKSVGLVDVRGQQNYPCVLPDDTAGLWGGDPVDGRTVDEGPCHSGYQCDLRLNGCKYYDQRRSAKGSRFVLSNYAAWQATGRGPNDLGAFNYLILDEAHAAESEVCRFWSASVSKSECYSFLNGLCPPINSNSSTWGGRWKNWARAALEAIEPNLSSMVTRYRNSQRGDDVIRRGKELRNKLALLLDGDPQQWVMSVKQFDRGLTWKWDLVWAKDKAESSLFRGIPKVILVSATIRQKTMDLLGIKKSESEFREYHSSFPASRRPVYVLRGAGKMSREHAETSRPGWLKAITEVTTTRNDRRGIIHAHSFDRISWIITGVPPKGRAMFLSHERGYDALRRAIEAYLDTDPSTLISPSVTTGVDFPYRDCEFQIIAKIPYPDMGDPAIRARCAKDPEYSHYVAMQDLVQAVGRGMRAKDDRCENFILDGSFGGLFYRYKKFAPSWFREAVKWRTAIPPVPPRVVDPRRPVRRKRGKEDPFHKRSSRAGDHRGRHPGVPRHDGPRRDVRRSAY